MNGSIQDLHLSSELESFAEKIYGNDAFGITLDDARKLLEMMRHPPMGFPKVFPWMISELDASLKMHARFASLH